jgi:hypothetical protein
VDECWRGPRSAAVNDIVATSVIDEAWPDFTVKPTA